jgi:hypothetical protein
MRVEKTMERLLEVGVAVVLVLAVMAGGATWQGSPGEGWVIIAGVPLLALAVFLHVARTPSRWGVLMLVAATMALPLWHALPWPGDIPPWATIHSKWQVDHARVFGVEPPNSLSLAPDASFRAFLSLVPPAAVFLGVLLMPDRRRRRMIVVIGLLALLSAVVGLGQALFGETMSFSPLGPTNGLAKGFFSNRNHFAALMYIGIAIGGVGLVLALRRMLADPTPARHAPIMIAWALGFLLLVVACMMARSRAGVLLGAGVILALFAMILSDTARSSRGSRRLFALVAISAILVAIQVGLWGVLERFRADPFEDARIVVQSTTWQAARDAAPWGTGVGTFRRVYEQREPLESVTSAWVNRAHNDWLEFRLEAGWPGSILLLFWGGWWLWSLKRRRHGTLNQREAEWSLVRSLAIVAIAAVALHSLVDFPMRTCTIFTIVAALVAISAQPLSIRSGQVDHASRA